MGPVVGPGEGPGVGPGEGPGVGPGEGPGVGPEEGPGEGPGVGPGEGPGEGPGVGPGVGPGGFHLVQRGRVQVCGCVCVIVGVRVGGFFIPGVFSPSCGGNTRAVFALGEGLWAACVCVCGHECACVIECVRVRAHVC